MGITILVIVCLVIYYFLKEKKKQKEYLESTYYNETQYVYSDVKRDQGKRGEYLTSKIIEQINSNKKILFNLFLPKENSAETSEIDICLITTKGIYVFENKNYSGWIYGNEEEFNWCETFNKNSKHKFYNPVKQNRNHIRYLKADLKKISIHSEDVIVCNTSELIGRLKEKASQIPQILEPENILEIYNILKQYHTPDRLDEHIKQIKSK